MTRAVKDRVNELERATARTSCDYDLDARITAIAKRITAGKEHSEYMDEIMRTIEK